nr:MAG TPA: hypothetical protein [Bacteriophage sp.]
MHFASGCTTFLLGLTPAKYWTNILTMESE